MSRSGPTGTAQTTASAASRSPVSSVTSTPLSHVDPAHDGAEPQTLAQLGRHPERDGGAALGDGHRLPHLEVVHAEPACRRVHAEDGEQRRALGGPARHAQVRQLAGPQNPRQGVLLAEPRVDREPIEPRRVRMAPGVVGVDRLGEGPGQPGEPLSVGPLLVGEPGELVADMHAVHQVGRHLAGVGDVARPQRQAELVDQPEVGGVDLADQLAAELDDAAVRKRRLLDPAAGPFAGLEHDDVDARPMQVARRREPAEARADDDDVGHRRLSSPSLSTIAPDARRARSRPRPPGPAR